MISEYNWPLKHYQTTVASPPPYHWLSRILKWPRVLVGGAFCVHIVCSRNLQDSLEALLFLWRRWIHCGWFSPATRPLHLGKEHREPGEDPAWNSGRTSAGCCCKRFVILLWNCHSVYTKIQDNHSRSWLCLIGCISILLCLWPPSVASCASNHCLHLQRCCVHLGSEPSGEWR